MLFSGKSNPSGRKIKSNQKENTFGKIKDLDLIGEQIAEGNDMHADECPEYFDEFEFDED
jgi:hypothetical protein